MKKITHLILISLFLVLLTSCSLAEKPAPATETAPPEAALVPTATIEAALPTPTDAPPTPEPTEPSTPEPYKPFEAAAIVDNLLLREGPGFLLTSVGMVEEGTLVKILGRAPGASWLYVETPEKHYGWMKLELLDLQGHSMYDAPEAIPGGFVIVKGHLYTPNGAPASDITLSLQPAEDDTPANSDAATTDVLGQFYFFLPYGSKGDWILSANAYGCESNAVNSACSLIGSFPAPITITLDPEADLWYNLQILP